MIKKIYISEIVAQKNMVKYTLTMTFVPEHTELIAKQANDRLDELVSRELIEDVSITESDAAFEATFFSNNANVTVLSIENSFNGIHDSVEARVFREELDNGSEAVSTEQVVESKRIKYLSFVVL